MNPEESFETRGWLSPPSRWAELKTRAREMRRAPTPAEVHLWQLLRGNTLGVRFRRQHAIGQFIVDFYCAAASLVVEVDGPIHDAKQDEDAERQHFLEANGFHVLRFTNDEVLQRLDEVAERIMSALVEQS